MSHSWGELYCDLSYHLTMNERMYHFLFYTFRINHNLGEKKQGRETHFLSLWNTGEQLTITQLEPMNETATRIYIRYLQAHCKNGHVSHDSMLNQAFLEVTLKTQRIFNFNQMIDAHTGALTKHCHEIMTAPMANLKGHPCSLEQCCVPASH